MSDVKSPDNADQAKVLESIRRGLEDMRAGRTQPVEAAIADLIRELQRPHGSGSPGSS